MSLSDVVILLLIGGCGLFFWQLRGVAERAKMAVIQYCKEQELQMLSIARVNTKIVWFKGKLTWKSTFAFEFSGNRTDKRTGHVELMNKRVFRFELPPYPVDPNELH